MLASLYEEYYVNHSLNQVGEVADYYGFILLYYLFIDDYRYTLDFENKMFGKPSPPRYSCPKNPTQRKHYFYSN